MKDCCLMTPHNIYTIVVVFNDKTFNPVINLTVMLDCSNSHIPVKDQTQ